MRENAMILPLLAALAIVIVAAKLGGWLSATLRQPVVLGELLAGLILGPSLLSIFELDYFHQAHVTEALHEFGELGVIFLMFAAGLEIHLSDFVKAGKPAVLTGIFGVVVPVALGTATVLAFGQDLRSAFFVGIVLAATSVSISAQTLMELRRLRSREGLTLLGAAVVDDVLAIAVLSAFVALTLDSESSVLGVVWIILRMVLFLAGAFFLGTWLLPRAARWVEDNDLPISEAVVSLVVVSVLIFAWASEVVGGVAAITGAFIAGVALSTSPLQDKIERGIRTMAYAFFVPIFLVSIGLSADLRMLFSGGGLWLAVAISAVAIVSKLVGAGLGAKLGGMTWPAAVRVGVGMVSRGEVGLIVAGVGSDAGLLNATDFAAMVLMVLVTTLITPPLLRVAFQEKETEHA
jgi:Kef-type K+ transport system membrane component KefB